MAGFVRIMILIQFHSHSLRWLVYIQRVFEQGDSMGTGTTSDADWACQGDEKNVLFFSIREGELPALVHPERL